MKLNEKIIYYRKKHGLSQEELGEKVGVSRQAVSKWETGDALPEVTKLKAIADIFGVTVDHFLDENDSSDAAASTESFEKDVGDDVQENENESKNTSSTLGIHSTGSGTSDRFGLFLKRYAWVGGILLILYGLGRLVSGVVMILSSMGTMGVFSSSILPISLMCIYQFAIGIVFIACGIYVIQKYKVGNLNANSIIGIILTVIGAVFAIIGIALIGKDIICLLIAFVVALVFLIVGIVKIKKSKRIEN